MNSFTFLIRLEFFQNFFTFLQIPFSEKFQDYNRETVSLIIRKPIHCDMQSQ